MEKLLTLPIYALGVLLIAIGLYWALSPGGNFYLKGPRQPTPPGARPIPRWLGRLSGLAFAAAAAFGVFGNLLFSNSSSDFTTNAAKIGMYLYWMFLALGLMYLSLTKGPGPHGNRAESTRRLRWGMRVLGVGISTYFLYVSLAGLIKLSKILKSYF